MEVLGGVTDIGQIQVQRSTASVSNFWEDRAFSISIGDKRTLAPFIKVHTPVAIRAALLCSVQLSHTPVIRDATRRAQGRCERFRTNPSLLLSSSLTPPNPSPSNSKVPFYSTRQYQVIYNQGLPFLLRTLGFNPPVVGMFAHTLSQTRATVSCSARCTSGTYIYLISPTLLIIHSSLFFFFLFLPSSAPPCTTSYNSSSLSLSSFCVSSLIAIIYELVQEGLGELRLVGCEPSSSSFSC